MNRRLDERLAQAMVLNLLGPCLGLLAVGYFIAGPRRLAWAGLGYVLALPLLLLIAGTVAIIYEAGGWGFDLLRVALYGYVALWSASVVHVAFLVMRNHSGEPFAVARTVVLAIGALAFPPLYATSMWANDRMWGLDADVALLLLPLLVAPIAIGAAFVALPPPTTSDGGKPALRAWLAALTPFVGFTGAGYFMERRPLIGALNVVAGASAMITASFLIYTNVWRETFLLEATLHTSILGYLALWIWQILAATGLAGANAMDHHPNVAPASFGG